MLFKTSIIEVDLTIPFHEIKENLDFIIKKELQKQYENKAFEDFGIIKKVKKINKLLFQKITFTGQLFFIYEIEVENFIPKKDDIIEIRIKKILPCGIFLEEEHLKVLVSMDTMIDSQLKINDMIQIRLKDIRYEKDAFHSLGELIV